MSLYTKLIHQMHTNFGFFEAVKKFSKTKLLDFLHFRADVQIREEVNELVDAIAAYREADEAGDEAAKNDAIHEINDALIDILVFTFGTASFTMTEDELEHSYWTVMQANNQKAVGIKPGRPNPFGLPDLVKPAGWIAPDITQFSRSLKLELNSRDAVVDEPAETVEPEVAQEEVLVVQQDQNETPATQEETPSEQTTPPVTEPSTDTPPATPPEENADDKSADEKEAA
jgi:predicted HAD superfamily Cof-like phosphohydrolase